MPVLSVHLFVLFEKPVQQVGRKSAVGHLVEKTKSQYYGLYYSYGDGLRTMTELSYEKLQEICSKDWTTFHLLDLHPIIKEFVDVSLQLSLKIEDFKKPEIYTMDSLSKSFGESYESVKIFYLHACFIVNSLVMMLLFARMRLLHFVYFLFNTGNLSANMSNKICS